jgi:phosphohistidine phosphatase
MKRLSLLRHAKSSWSGNNLKDRDRPLNQRGERDAPYMGARFLARKLRPSLIITSPAVRAVTTARSIADALGYPFEFVQREADLYLASPQAILEVVATQDDNFNNVLLVGHNPGLTDIINELLPNLRLDNLPTAGIVCLDSEAETWADIAKANLELVFYDYPKNPENLVIEKE